MGVAAIVEVIPAACRFCTTLTGEGGVITGVGAGLTGVETAAAGFTFTFAGEVVTGAGLFVGKTLGVGAAGTGTLAGAVAAPVEDAVD